VLTAERLLHPGAQGVDLRLRSGSRRAAGGQNRMPAGRLDQHHEQIIARILRHLAARTARGARDPRVAVSA
jgi:hypothetical protein